MWFKETSILPQMEELILQILEPQLSLYISSGMVGYRGILLIYVKQYQTTTFLDMGNNPSLFDETIILLA